MRSTLRPSRAAPIHGVGGPTLDDRWADDIECDRDRTGAPRFFAAKPASLFMGRHPANEARLRRRGAGGSSVVDGSQLARKNGLRGKCQRRARNIQERGGNC